MRVVIVGAGVGGLAVAARLAAAGHDVTVFERNPVPGGKFHTYAEQGFTFDQGPSLLTVPHLVDELFDLADTSLADEVDLVRLDPQIRYHWSDGSALDVADGEAAWLASLDAFSPGSASEWSAFADRSARVWDAMEQTMFTGPVDLGIMGRARSVLGRLDGNRTLAAAADASFTDPRLRQLIGRYATWAGSSPFEAPAMFASMLHAERAFGCWYVMGGLGRLRDALVRLAEQLGVDVRLGVDVGRIVMDGKRVGAVELADGGSTAADVVVANVDAAHLYVDLLPRPKEARALDKHQRSMSAFVICAAVEGETEGVAHHNVWFSMDDAAEFRSLVAGQMPVDPTVYACVSSVTDPSRAPAGWENWCIVVNTPPAIGIDRKIMTAGILNRLAERGVDLRRRIDFTRTVVPADFDARFRAPGGSIHGTSSNGKRAAFARPANRGPVEGLYLVGGSTHPGGGLPFVVTGARIVADLIADDHA